MATAESRIFISYHRNDLAIAEQVRTYLVGHGAATWMDQYDIPSGAYWPDEIDKGLSSAEVVVGLLSPDSVDSRNVKNEWDWALGNGKRLLLLLARPCVIPHRYVSIHFIDASGEKMDEALDTLIHRSGILVAEPDLPVPKTRYAQAGGLSVAWQESGAGEFDLVYVPGFISHLEHQWRNPTMTYYLRRFGTLGRILRFDKRGTGMSDRAIGIPTLEERMDDIRVVMDAAGSERAVLYGLSEGVPLSIQFAATYPERTRALILYGGSATYVSKPDYPWQKSLEEWNREIENDEANLANRWGSIEQAKEASEHFCPSLADDETWVEWFAEYFRLSASPGAAIALDRMNLEVDVRSILPLIKVPTLVAHRVDELDADINEGRYIAARIPGAVMKELPGNDHWPVAGDYDSFFGAIEEFLATLGTAPVADSSPESVLATVVQIRYGQNSWVPDGDEVSQIALLFRCQVVEPSETGIVAAFDGSARALRFANALLNAAAEHGATFGGGAHAGEVFFANGRATGIPSDVAATIADLAAPDELLVTRTVRDLVAGSGITFGDASARQSSAFPEVSLLVVNRKSLI